MSSRLRYMDEESLRTQWEQQMLLADHRASFGFDAIPMRDYKLMDGVYIIPHKTADGRAAGKRENMFLRKHGRWEHDDFSHEQSLVFETEKGLVIFSSCSHAGATAIIEEIAQTFPGRKVHGIIGGFHLYNKTEAEVRSLAARIRETGIEFICTGHCTGDKAYDILKKELGDSLCQLHVNKVMEF